MRTIESIKEQYGEQKLINFIFNRHCSRFNPHDISLDDALEIAWQYHTTEEDIVSDFETVESYNDLDQYFRL